MPQLERDHHHQGTRRPTSATASTALAFCDERIVVDAASSDGTLMIAKQKGARVATHGWNGFGPQKNYALSLAQGDWVLSIDADERVTPALAQAIRAAIEKRQGRRLRNLAPLQLLRPHDAAFGLVSGSRAAAVPARQGALHRRCGARARHLRRQGRAADRADPALPGAQGLRMRSAASTSIRRSAPRSSRPPTARSRRSAA